MADYAPHSDCIDSYFGFGSTFQVQKIVQECPQKEFENGSSMHRNLYDEYHQSSVVLSTKTVSCEDVSPSLHEDCGSQWLLEHKYSSQRCDGDGSLSGHEDESPSGYGNGSPSRHKGDNLSWLEDGSSKRQDNGSGSRQAEGIQIRQGNGNGRRHAEGSPNRQDGGSVNIHVEGSQNRGDDGNGNRHAEKSPNRQDGVSGSRHAEGGPKRQDGGNLSRHLEDNPKRQNESIGSRHVEGNPKRQDGGNGSRHVEGNPKRQDGGNGSRHVEGNPKKQYGGSGSSHVEGTPKRQNGGIGSRHIEGNPKRQNGGNGSKHVGGSPKRQNGGNGSRHVEGNPKRQDGGNGSRHVEGNPKRQDGGNWSRHVEGNPKRQDGGNGSRHVEGTPKRQDGSRSCHGFDLNRYISICRLPILVLFLLNIQHTIATGQTNYTNYETRMSMVTNSDLMLAACSYKLYGCIGNGFWHRNGQDIAAAENNTGDIYEENRSKKYQLRGSRDCCTILLENCTEQDFLANYSFRLGFYQRANFYPSKDPIFVYHDQDNQLSCRYISKITQLEMAVLHVPENFTFSAVVNGEMVSVDVEKREKVGILHQSVLKISISKTNISSVKVFYQSLFRGEKIIIYKGVPNCSSVELPCGQEVHDNDQWIGWVVGVGVVVVGIAVLIVVIIVYRIRRKNKNGIQTSSGDIVALSSGTAEEGMDVDSKDLDRSDDNLLK